MSNNNMFITPITKINSLEQFNTDKLKEINSTISIPFKTMFQEAMNNVKQTDANVNQAIEDLATGKADNIHELTNASTQATLAVELMIQLRNKALDAYNEIMRMGI